MGRAYYHAQKDMKQTNAFQNLRDAILKVVANRVFTGPLAEPISELNIALARYEASTHGLSLIKLSAHGDLSAEPSRDGHDSQS